MLVLGSSLRVSPACEMPKAVKQHGGKLALVNLQTTPCDDVSAALNGHLAVCNPSPCVISVAVVCSDAVVRAVFPHTTIVVLSSHT